MPMPKATTAEEAAQRAGPRKRESVEDLAAQLSRATSAVVTDYRGLTVKQLEDLRTQLRSQGIEYRVIKNTLARRAAEQAGIAQLGTVLSGPVGLALGFGELSAPAKALSDYHRINRRLPLLVGFVEGEVLDARGVLALAELPPREILLAQLAAALQMPLSQLAAALSSTLSNLAATLDAYRVKLEAA
ncbi:MAG TPA: 50S ribosomal protein L10 [Chloroflexi bacterium]|jgi:large subunit ribosomal protein L10|nr:50S ribosomal protein L10 [Chloroflexota bacterium]HBV94474.1 50S ribosomal protein L10 [Chloroflexota bacterium]